jgi:hypothetical protein
VGQHLILTKRSSFYQPLVQLQLEEEPPLELPRRQQQRKEKASLIAALLRVLVLSLQMMMMMTWTQCHRLQMILFLLCLHPFLHQLRPQLNS